MSGPVCRFRFGRFELVAHTGELFADGRRVPLAHQSFVLLRLLLERSGDVVSRDDARHALWPDGTHVDYDHGLNNAAARLRRALGDTPAAPRIFETLPRVGYRLLVPVVAIEVGTVPSVPGPGQPAGRWSIGGWRAAVVAAGVFAAGAGSGVLWSLRPVAAVPSPASVTAEARDQAERSLAYTRLVLAGDLAADVAYEPAGDAATRALALDPTLAHAQVSAGYVAMWGRWD
ncbi:MAG TPA: winged helix-turn-helix domain-containing protein, partial [Vicinamibacterales bacterium]|nr:winged helix-turn-helix domain-containing protein [Vicinamibacterales bacterium]